MLSAIVSVLPFFVAVVDILCVSDGALYTVKGTDAQEAAANVNGHIMHNTINRNEISSAKALVMSFGQADYNVFRVSREREREEAPPLMHNTCFFATCTINPTVLLSVLLTFLHKQIRSVYF